MDVLAAVGEDQAEAAPAGEECTDPGPGRVLVAGRGLVQQGGGGVRHVEEAEDGQLQRVRQVEQVPVESGAGVDEDDAVAEVAVGETALYVSVLPAAHGLLQTDPAGRGDAAFGRVEEVDQVGEFGVGQVVDVVVVGGGAQVVEAEFGPVEVGAETFDLDAGGVEGRGEVVQGGHLVADRVVVLLRLAGEAVEVVPVQVHADGFRVAQQPDVLAAGHALVHEFQHPAAEVFHTGLDVADARRAEDAQLFAPQVRLDLVAQPQVVAGLLEAGRHRAEIGHVEDVVGDPHVEDAVPLDQPEDLLDEPLRILAAELHERSVEPAEGAVVLCAPPAPARALHDDTGLHPAARGGACVPVEVVAVLGSDQRRRRQGLGLHRVGDGTALRVPPAQAGDPREVAAVPERGQQLGERRLALTPYDEVDERKVPVQRRALRPVAVRAAEHGHRVRSAGLDRAGGGEGGRVLRERRGEADDVGRFGGDPGGGLPHEQRSEFVQFPCLGEQRLGSPFAQGLAERRDVPAGQLVEGGREDPLAVSGEVRAGAEVVLLEREIGTRRQPVHVVEIGVHDIDPGVREDVADPALEDAQGQRRSVDRRPRHVHQHDVHDSPFLPGRAGPSRPAGPPTWAAASPQPAPGQRVAGGVALGRRGDFERRGDLRGYGSAPDPGGCGEVRVGHRLPALLPGGGGRAVRPGGEGPGRVPAQGRVAPPGPYDPLDGDVERQRLFADQRREQGRHQFVRHGFAQYDGCVHACVREPVRVRGDEADQVRGERLLLGQAAPGVGKEPEPAELLGAEEPGEEFRVPDARRREEAQTARKRGGEAAVPAQLPDGGAELAGRAVEFAEVDRFQALQLTGSRGDLCGSLVGQAMSEAFVQQQPHQQVGELLTVQMPAGRRFHNGPRSCPCHSATSALSRS